MKKVMMGTLMFFFFVNQVMHIFGNVIILSGPANLTNRKLICVSEDDGGALLWSNSIEWNYFFRDEQNKLEYGQMYNLNRYSNNKIDCKMNADEECLKSWSKQNWSLTNSLETPMGPVFDERWKDFKEYEIRGNGYDHVNLNATAIILSFYYPDYDWYILFCNGKDYHKNFCYRFKIQNSISYSYSLYLIIQKCIKGVSLISEGYESDAKCSDVAIFHREMMLYNLQTFIIKWNPVTRNISIYDTDDFSMTYEDTEKSEHSLSNYHMFIKSPFNGKNTISRMLRVHIYDFLHTTLENANLTSPIVTFYGGTICIQMLLGLCAECEAHIRLLNSANNEVLKTVRAKGSAAKHGLSMWQSVKIEKNLATTSYNNVRIQLIPKLNTPSSNSLWAIANVRQCPKNGTLKSIVVHQKKKYSSRFEEKYWPHMLCQKIFYDKFTIVSSDKESDYMRIEHVLDCPRGKIGPQCLISCEHDLQSNAECHNITVCNIDGCTCPLGFLGQSCSERVEKANLLTVTSINKTSIRVSLPVTWDYNYERTAICYSFNIKGQEYSHQQSWKRIFKNTRQLIGHFENLTPDTAYKIRCSIQFPEYKVHSDWIIVSTNCNPVEGFDIFFKETSTLIDWRVTTSQSYLCQANWYHLVVRNTDTDKQIINKPAMYFPRKLSLTLYSSFNMTILYKDDKLFSQEIRTREGGEF